MACHCQSCIAQLKKPYDCSKKPTEQERYARNINCSRWKIFEGTNDWEIVYSPKKDGNDHGMMRQAMSNALETFAENNKSTTIVGGYCVIPTAPLVQEPFYIAKYTSETYVFNRTRIEER